MVHHLGQLRGLAVWGRSPSRSGLVLEPKTALHGQPVFDEEPVRAQLVVLELSAPREDIDGSKPGEQVDWNALDASLPTALVSFAATSARCPNFPQVTFATSYLCAECGGDEELAGSWLDAAATLLDDPSILLPPPPELRAVYTERDFIVFSVPREELVPHPQLTKAENAILKLLVQGMSNADSARERGRAVRTVTRQVLNIFRKLGVHSRAEATLLSIQRTSGEHD